MSLVMAIVLFFVTLFSLITKYIDTLSHMVSAMLRGPSTKEVNLSTELKSLRHEINQINMSDEFAKYAKKERKINKAREELKVLKNSRKEFSMKVSVGLKAIFHILQIGTFLTLIYTYRSRPLLELPAEWLWPVHSVFSFPSWISGGVSITVWLLTCRVTVRAFLDAFT